MRSCDLIIEALFRIANKNSVTVDFILNNPQLKYSQGATQRDIILKARREGFSSYTLAEFTIACLSEPNTSAVVMSHEGDATERHLARVHFYLKHLKGAAPLLERKSKNLLTFPKTDSSFYMGTAGARTFGRGDTITHLHLSEAAFYEFPKVVVGGALQAASHAKRIVVESTANGYNWFKRLCDKSIKGKGGFKLHFFAWFEDPDNYNHAQTHARVPKGYIFDDEDLDLRKMYKLTYDQLYWYITKREEIMESPDDMDGLRLFRQEYPCSIRESFQSSGAQYIGMFTYEESKCISEGKLKTYKLPERGHKYVIGGDISAGIGKNYFVANILDASTLEQVAVHRDNWTNPAQAAHVLARLGRRYNNAYIIPELNNHGVLTVEVLKRAYPLVMIYQRVVHDSKNIEKKRTQLGFITSEKGRYHAVNTMKIYLKRGLIVRDVTTKDELYALEEGDGRLQAPQGEFDDCVLSLALACVGVKKLVRPKIEVPEPEKPEIDYTKPLFPYANLDEASDMSYIPKQTFYH